MVTDAKQKGRVNEPRAKALAVAIGLALAALPPVALGADDAGETDRNKLDEVSVLGQRMDTYLEDELSSRQYTADLLDTARTINVISSDVIRDQGADSLSDILMNVPGISMQAGEGGAPAGDQLSIRGFSARTDIFIDGVRDFGGYARDSYNVSQVEVAKGPGSNYTGRGSTGGSINLVSKNAVEENFLVGNVGIGNEDYKRLTLDFNRKLTDTAAMRVNLLAHDADVPDRDVAENSRWGIAPTATFGLGTDTQFIFSYSHLGQDNMPDYGIPWVPGNNTALPDHADGMPPVDDANWYGMKDRDFEEISNDLATALFEHDFSDRLIFSNQLRWGNTDRDSLITSPRFNSTDSTDIRRTDWKSRDQEDRILNNLAILTAEFDTGSWSHSIATGFELSDEYEINYIRNITGNQPVTDLYNPTPNDQWGGTIFRTGASTEADGFSTSLFVGDTITFNEHWQVTAGLRWDRFKLDYDNTLANGTVQSFERTDDEWSYQGSLVYKPAANGSIYAGYGTSFNPSGEGLALATVSVAMLDPEEGNSFELGTKWELLNNNLLLNAALFRTEKTNARETDPVDATVTVLSGEQRVDGLELGAVGRLNDRWNLIAGYTHMESEILESVNPALVGNELANTPENTFSLWTTWQATTPLELGAGAQYVDDRYSATNNLRSTDDYMLFNAMASYVFNQSVTLRLNATNLTDEDYAGNVGGGHYIPGEGRSVIFSVDLGF